MPRKKSWCPVCGDCTCPCDEDGARDHMDDPDCPLHGLRSKHAPEPEAIRLFHAEVIVGTDGMLAVRGGNLTNREWMVDTFTGDRGDGEIDVTIVVRGRVRGTIVPNTGGMGVRVDFNLGTRKHEES